MLKSYFKNDEYRKILLLRHGELYTGGKKLYVGQADIPLSAVGVQQAHVWAEVLREIPLARIVSSDLSRCAETAGIIAAKQGLTVEHDPRWREISFGDWDGRDWDEVLAEFPEAVAARYDDFIHARPANGENFLDLQARVMAAFDELLARNIGGTVLVVAHAGVNRTLLAHLMGLPDRNIFHIYQDFSCMNVIDAKDGQVRHVRAVNVVN